MKLVAALALVTAALVAPIARAAPADLYVAGIAPERPAVLCELVVRQIGALASFAVAGKAYDADQLAKCNAKAKQD